MIFPASIEFILFVCSFCLVFPLQSNPLLSPSGPTFVKNYRGDRTFALVAELENSTPPQFRKLWIAGLAAGVMVALASADVLNLLIGALLAAMIMIIAGCISSEQVGN